MKRLTIFSLTCLFSMGAVFAQRGVTQCGVPTGQPKFPLLTYQELPDPTAPSDKEWVAVTSTQVSWGTTDVRYAKHQLPQLKKQQTVSLKGWRGERVNAQAVVWTGVELKDLNFSFGDFKDKKGNVLPKDAFTGGFVRYVMTDELNKDGRGACGYRKSIDYDSLLVADPIDTNLKTMALPARTVQPVWVQCWIPQSATPGTYQGELLINDGSRLLQRLNLEITVSSRELPQPSEWAYHLDLWQSPYAVARYYQVPLWSQEHFDAMRPLMKMLADAGQKIITATLTHKPWNGQTEDYFDTMVTWMKRADGTWAFDYTIFDRWVEFMMSVGIDKQINCYSMVPWELSFQYYDQATNSLQFVKTAPGEAAYEEMWGAMLASFSKHLKEKGWFDICAIAMDERPMEVMQKTLKVIRKADPDFKVSLAGNYHEEIEPDLYDYCIGIPRMDVLSFEADKHLIDVAKEACAKVLPEIGTHIGRVVSGDQFISDKAVKERISANFDGYCTEMEGAAIAQAAYLNKVPFVILRAISDKADDSATMDYPTFEKQAIENSVKLIKELVGQI